MPGEKTHWDQILTDEHGKTRPFQYVEFQCGFKHPLRRFKARFLDMRIVDEHKQQWSNGASVDFKGKPYYAISLGPRIGDWYCAPVKEKGTPCPVTPKKRKRSGGRDPPAKGRESGRGAEITLK